MRRAAELETVALRLIEQEQELAARKQSLETEDGELQQRRAELAQTRLNLEGWQSRLAAQGTAWETERSTLLAQIQAREGLAERHMEIVKDLRQRWSQRRRQEVERLRAEYDHCQEVRKQLKAVREAQAQQETALQQEQRQLAEKALALEQYRQKCIGRSKRSASIEQRLERLRCRWSALSATEERKLEQKCKELQAESAILDDRQRQLRERAAEINKQAADLSDERTAWEHEVALVKAQEARSRQEIEIFDAQRKEHEQQIENLREEVERLGRGAD